MLQACLRVLYALEIPQGWDVEVLVVDNDVNSSLSEILPPVLSRAALATRYVIEPVQ